MPLARQNRSKFSTIAAVVTLALVPAIAAAQSTDRKGGPESGTWAGEVGTASAATGAGPQTAALLRFFSSHTALVSAFAFSRRESEGTLGVNNGISSLALQVGVRRYTRTGLGIRPIFGGGLVLNRNRFGTSGDTGIGAYGEAGAAWFFNPHVSLGVLGGLNIVGSDNARTIGGTLARVTAAVYF